MKKEFDFKNPEYASVFQERAQRLIKIRENPGLFQSLLLYYSTHPADFINDWGVTYDPRNSGSSKPTLMPFILYPKQRECIDWIMERYKNNEPGIIEKSRTVGLSWISVALACTLCIFQEGMAIGMGSRKQEYVDERGNLKSLLEKARMFIKYLPPEFRAGFDLQKHSKLMLLKFPNTNSYIEGESGDGIGRGGRTRMYLVDESAFLERPHLVDASLSENTNCRIDISTVNGFTNSFAERRHSGNVPVFTFHWRSDPRRDEIWYAKKVAELNNPVIVAQELDICYTASVTGVVIPNQWIQAAIDAHIKLNIKPSGIKKGAWDVADEGNDQNAFVGRHGILINYIEEWSGVNGDLMQSTARVFNACDLNGYSHFDYDADGLGAGIRGDSRVLNEYRLGNTKISISPFHGAAEVIDPKAQVSESRTNQDFYYNYKSQSWWHLRELFLNTYRAVVEGSPFNPDKIISISSNLSLCDKLMTELSQPTFSINNAGKILINKKPDGARSPNLADAVMIAFAPKVNRSFIFTDDDISTLERF